MTILVPTDFAPASDAAVQLATEIALERQTAVKLLHAVPLPGAALLSVEPLIVPPALWDELLGESRSEGQAKLESMAEEMRQRGVEVSVELGAGSAAEVIVEAASDAELVVMGSHGSSGAERVVFGSVAEAVSRASKTPVLVTHADAEPSARFQTVIAGIDLTPASQRVAEEACRYVARGGVLELVTVLHAPVFRYFGSTAMTGATARLQEALAKERRAAASALEDLASRLPDEDFTVNGVVEEGRTSEVLINRAENASLVVVGAHPREDLGERVLGTTADRVLRHSPNPVLLFPTA